MATNNAGTNLSTRLGDTGSLLGALDAITRWKPFLLMVATFVTCLIVGGVLATITAALMESSRSLSGMMGALAFLIILSIGLVGANAVGVMLSDDVWGRPQRNIGSALMVSALTVHRLLLILLIEGLLFLVYLIALTLVLFLCKIPGLGPLLYAIAMPLGVVLTGAVLFALIYVAIPLAAPAVWNGASVMQALAMLREVARHKLLFVVIMSLILGLLLLVVTGIIIGILSSGAGITLSLSSLVVGSSMGGLGNFMGLFYGLGQQGVSGYLWALSFGAAALALIGITPGILVGMKGAAIIHHTAIDGLSLSEAEAELSQKFADVQRKAREAADNAKAQIAAAQATAMAAPVTVPKIQPKCQACQSIVSPDDVFCGDCGHRLK